MPMESVPPQISPNLQTRRQCHCLPSTGGRQRTPYHPGTHSFPGVHPRRLRGIHTETVHGGRPSLSQPLSPGSGNAPAILVGAHRRSARINPSRPGADGCGRGAGPTGSRHKRTPRKSLARLCSGRNRKSRAHSGMRPALESPHPTRSVQEVHAHTPECSLPVPGSTCAFRMSLRF